MLRSQGVVAFPTDTLYGLGADATSAQAVTRAFTIKGRPAHMAMPLLLGDLKDLDLVVRDVPPVAWPLVERFWPGPLTLVLLKAVAVSSLITGGMDSVAVRIPNHPVPVALARGLGGPITGTSANISGGPDPLTADDVRKSLGDSVDYIIDAGDAGPATMGCPSTVLDLTGTIPKMVRAGAIHVSALETACMMPIERA